MATINLGRVGFVQKGAYSGATTYKINDVVVYNNGVYACISPTTGNLPTNTSYWKLWLDPSTLVAKTGDETIAGVKTFSSSPIVPNATTATQAIAYGQAVKNTGDETIAGIKTFSNNLVFAGGTKIQCDFSNATLTSRTFFQTSVTDSPSNLQVIPNGSATLGGFIGFNNSNPTNSSWAQLRADQASITLASGTSGTGTYLPITITTSGIERMKIDTSGNVLVTGSGGLGYGTGSGGTVTQLTSKSTAVTLNKPCGKIIMHNASLSAGASVAFAFTNSSMTNPQDILLLQCLTINTSSYELKAVGYGVNDSVITVKNVSGGALSEALVLNFAIIKGATA